MAKQTRPISYIAFSPGDFLNDLDFRSWDARLCGAYFNLLLTLYTNKGRMPDDIILLCRSAQWHGRGFKQAWITLRKKFQVRRGCVTHKRVTLELERARSALQQKQDAGLRGAQVRWQGYDTANGPANSDANAEEREERKKKESRVTWDGTAFYIPLDAMAEFQSRWPNITHEAIDQEIRDCAAYHREHKTQVKAPRARIMTWLKKAFDQYQQQEAPVQKRPGQNLRAVLGLEDGAEKHGSDDTTES